MQWRIQGGGGGVLIYLSCRPFSLQSFLLFLPKIRVGGGRGPSPRSATAISVRFSFRYFMGFDLGCVSLTQSMIGFLNPKESENGFCVSLLSRPFQDLSDHCLFSNREGLGTSL